MGLEGATGRIVDTMVGLPPEPGDESWRDQLRPLLKDRESLEGFAHPASYMFKNLPDARFADDPGLRWIRSRVLAITKAERAAARRRRASRT